MISSIFGIYFPRRKPPRVSKTLKIFFIILHVCALLDFGYKTNSKKINNALKYYIFVVGSLFAFLLFVMIVFDLYRLITFYCYLYLVQYLLNIYFLLICDRNKTLYALLESLSLIDNEINFQKSHKIELTLIIYVVITVTLNIIMAIVSFCFLNDMSCSNSIAECVILFIVSVYMRFSLVLNFFIFYSVYCRLKKLRSIVEHINPNIVLYQHFYKFLIDSTERSQKVFDYLLIMILLIQVPQMMQILYNTVKSSNISFVAILNDIIVCIYTIQYMIVIFLPPLLATMLNTEAHRLTLVLHDKLLSEIGSTRKDEIKRFIEYIDARPFRLYVCHLIPLDYKYPIIIINLYVTYTIVIAQFSLTC